MNITLKSTPHFIIPKPLKYIYTLFMAVLIPVYWYYYGPTNFLYFCDVALILTLISIWTEKAIFVSMAAVGIIFPQIIWVIDFVLGCCGISLLGMTDYMFDEKRSLFLRGLSLFHGWLPFLLWYMVKKIGYDKRALLFWTILAWGLMLFSYGFLPEPTTESVTYSVNVDYVYGLKDTTKQTWLPELGWLGLLLVGLPALVYFPTHLFLKCFSKN